MHEQRYEPGDVLLQLPQDEGALRVTVYANQEGYVDGVDLEHAERGDDNEYDFTNVFVEVHELPAVIDALTQARDRLVAAGLLDPVSGRNAGGDHG